jgi:hypothetical protein
MDVISDITTNNKNKQVRHEVKMLLCSQYSSQQNEKENCTVEENVY